VSDGTTSPAERCLSLCCLEAGRGRHLAEGLRESGYSVRLASSLPLLLTGTDAQPIDLLVVELPSVDDDVVRALHRRCPTLIVAHAPLSVGDAARLIQSGAYDVLPSPLRLSELRLSLEKAAAREASLGDRRAARFAPVPVIRTEPNPSVAAPVPAGVIAESKVMRGLLAQVARVAVHPTSVLLLGESGTGKEVLARSIHQLSPRRDGPFIAINCGALPEALLESLLFGHVQGAFTDAVRDQQGVFARASGGTLFLDEIGELPLALQVKLLRALQEQKILPLGAKDELSVDVRVIAATLRNLSREVDAKRFRADLYYRLSVVELLVPPLRERRDDIMPLAVHFLRRAAQRLARPIVGITDAAARALLRFDFPGNVRELENLIERAVVLCDHTQLDVTDLPYSVASPSVSLDDSRVATMDVDEGSDGDFADLSVKSATARLEQRLIARALHKTRGNRTAAAKLLGLSHRALLYKLREYGMAGEKEP
jgi:DNA-binding NtrC family response regulator